jgi:hypothetical protein
MKNLNENNFQDLTSEESQNICGGGLIVFAFLAGLAVGYYEQRIKDK